MKALLEGLDTSLIANRVAVLFDSESLEELNSPTTYRGGSLLALYDKNKNLALKGDENSGGI